MDKQNLEDINHILNEIGYCLVGTMGQHGLEWDYACYISSKMGDKVTGQFFLFEDKKLIKLKSLELMNTLNGFFAKYRKALVHLESFDATIKYVFRNADFKADVKVDKELLEKWSRPINESDPNLFKTLVNESF